VRSADGARTIQRIEGRDPAGLRSLDRELLERLVQERCPSAA